MSGDPKRWLDGDGGATDAERDLLRSADDVEPAPGAHDATWAALATRLPPPGGGAPPGPGPAGGAGGAGSATSGGAIGAKVLAVGVIGVVIAVGAVVVMRPSRAPEPSPTSSTVATLAVDTPTPTPSAQERAVTETRDDPQPAVPAPVKGSGAAPTLSGSRLGQGHAAAAPASIPSDSASAKAGSAMSATDALKDEIALVAAARGALRRGDGPAALASLEKARKQHPRGALLQEREVLMIEALAQSGDTAGASRRASAFLRAFPTSPHAAHVRTFER